MAEKEMHPLVDKEKQKTAKLYRKHNRSVSILSYIFLVVFLILLLYSDVSRNIVVFMERALQVRALTILGYFTILYILYSVISFPFVYWSGYVIEHRFGFSTQTFRQWLLDWIKSFCVNFILGGIVFEFIFLITYISTEMWWLWLAAAMIIFSVVLTNLFPVVILPLFYKTTPLDDAELKQHIQAVCEKVRIPLRGVFSINLSSKSTKANAAVVGFGNTKRILLGDTLLADYSMGEILSVLCHEIVHFVERHIWWLTATQSAVTILLFYLFYRIHPFFYGLVGFTRVSEIAAFPLFALIFVALSFIVKPLTAGVSRYFERRADRGALNLTHDAASFISVMAKFCNKHLMIAYPNRFIEWYKYTHPSPGNRIRFAEKWQKNQR